MASFSLNSHSCDLRRRQIWVMILTMLFGLQHVDHNQVLADYSEKDKIEPRDYAAAIVETFAELGNVSNHVKGKLLPSAEDFARTEEQYIQAVATAYNDSDTYCEQMNLEHAASGDPLRHVQTPWLSHLMENIATVFLLDLMRISMRHVDDNEGKVGDLSNNEEFIEEVLTKYSLWADGLGAWQSARDGACKHLGLDQTKCGLTLIAGFRGEKYRDAVREVMKIYIEASNPDKFHKHKDKEDTVVDRLRATADTLLDKEGRLIDTHIKDEPESRGMAITLSGALHFLERWARELTFHGYFETVKSAELSQKNIPDNETIAETLSLFGEDLQIRTHVMVKLVLQGYTENPQNISHGQPPSTPPSEPSEPSELGDQDGSEHDSGLGIESDRVAKEVVEQPLHPHCGNKLCHLTFKALGDYHESWLSQIKEAGGEWAPEVEFPKEQLAKKLKEMRLGKWAAVEYIGQVMKNQCNPPPRRRKIKGNANLVELRRARFKEDYEHALKPATPHDPNNEAHMQELLVEAAKFFMLRIQMNDPQYSIVGVLFLERFLGIHAKEPEKKIDDLLATGREVRTKVLADLGISEQIIRDSMMSMSGYVKQAQTTFFKLVEQQAKDMEMFYSRWEEEGYGKYPYPISNDQPQLDKKCWMLSFMLGGTPNFDWLMKEENGKWTPPLGITGHGLPSSYPDDDWVNQDGSGVDTLGIFYDLENGQPEFQLSGGLTTQNPSTRRERSLFSLAMDRSCRCCSVARAHTHHADLYNHNPDVHIPS